MIRNKVAPLRRSIFRGFFAYVAVAAVAGCGPVEQLSLGGAGEACSAQVTKIEPVQLDMIILLDQSGSMAQMVSGGTKWTMVAYALESFLNDRDSAGIGVALQFFSLPLPGQMIPTDTMFSCVSADYATPAVPMDVLPGNGAHVAAAIGQHMPSGPTPTNTALGGVVTYARVWAEVNPTHRAVIVLATDGEPHGCEATPTVVDVAATAFAGTPPIATYVIGVSQLLTTLDHIARAGGTSQAFIIDTTTNGTKQFVDAMRSIRLGQGFPCDYAIPNADDAAPVDVAQINLDYRPGPDRVTSVPLWRVTDGAHCGLGKLGWYYNAAAPSRKVRLCDSTCSAIEHDIHGEMNLSVGCPNRVD